MDTTKLIALAVFFLFVFVAIWKLFPVFLSITLILYISLMVFLMSQVPVSIGKPIAIITTYILIIFVGMVYKYKFLGLTTLEMLVLFTAFYFGIDYFNKRGGIVNL